MRGDSRTTRGIIFLTIFLDLVGFSIIFPLFPALLDHYFTLEGTESSIGALRARLETWTAGEEGQTRSWLVQTLFGGILGSIYSLLQFLFSPVWGRWSDRTGRRPILIGTVAGIALSYLIWLVSGSFLLLVLSRVLGGIMSGNLATATAAMADITDRRNRAQGMGIVGAAFGLGFILGPALGGLLWTIDLTAVLPALEATATRPIGLHPFSAAAAGALLLSLINLVYLVRRFRETLPPERRRPSAERRTVNVLRFFDQKLGPDVRRTNLAYFVFLVAFSGMEFTLTFLVRERFGWTPGAMAGMFVYVGLIIAYVQGRSVRKLAPRLGEKRLAVVGLAIVAPGLALLSIAQHLPTFFGGLTLMAVGSALAIPTLTALVSLYSPESAQGATIGIFRSLGALSRALGPVLACLAYWRWGSGSPYWLGALVLILPVWVATRLPQPARS